MSARKAKATRNEQRAIQTTAGFDVATEALICAAHLMHHLRDKIAGSPHESDATVIGYVLEEALQAVMNTRTDLRGPSALAVSTKEVKS